MAFACITPALVTGSMAERMKLSAFVVWVALWTLLVYPLIAHWGFSPGGWRVAHAAIQISMHRVQPGCMCGYTTCCHIWLQPGHIYGCRFVTWGALDFAGGYVVHSNAGLTQP